MKFSRANCGDAAMKPGGALLARKLVPIFLLFALSVILYGRSVSHEFVWDSRNVVLEDPTIRDLRRIPGFFTKDYFSYLETGLRDNAHLKYYRPLLKVYFCLLYSVFGNAPAGYHGMNVLLNALVVVMAFLVVEEIAKDRRLALVAALLYAANPTRAEVVYWVYSASNILMALLSLTAFRLFLKGRRGWSLLCFGAAMLTRESAVLFPAAIVAYEFFYARRRKIREYVDAAYYAGVAGIYLIVRYAVAGAVPVSTVNVSNYLVTAMVIVKRYLKILCIPDGPVTAYRNLILGPSSPEALSAFLVLAAVAVLIVYWRRHPAVMFWSAWFFTWIGTSFNIGTIGEYLIAEKTLYLAALGPSVLTATAALSPKGTWARRLGVTAVAIVVLVHGGTTIWRGQFWQDSGILLRTLAAWDPEFALVQRALAEQYSREGLGEEAVQQYRRTIALSPTMPGLFYDLGVEFVRQERYTEALTEFRKALQLNPQHSEALTAMGNIWYLQGEFEAAAGAWRQAIVAEPRNAVPYMNMGKLLESLGRREEAEAFFRKYRELVPDGSGEGQAGKASP